MVTFHFNFQMTSLKVIQKEGNLHALLEKVESLDLMNYRQKGQFFSFHLVSFKVHFIAFRLLSHLSRYFNYLLLDLRMLKPHYILFMHFHQLHPDPYLNSIDLHFIHLLTLLKR